MDGTDSLRTYIQVSGEKLLLGQEDCRLLSAVVEFEFSPGIVQACLARAFIRIQRYTYTSVQQGCDERASE